MGQITRETIACIRRAVDAGQAPPLTLWEFQQLAWLAERQIASTPSLEPRNSEPLTPEQRRELIERAGDITDGLNQDDFADEIVKLTEQAHGICATPPSAVEAAQPEAAGEQFVLHIRHDGKGDPIRGQRNNLDDWLYARAHGDVVTLTATAPTTESASSSDAERLDAARYRWLREQHDGEAESFCVFGPSEILDCLEPVGSLPGELDAAIDAAIATKGGKL